MQDEKKQRKADARAKIEAASAVVTVTTLADEYFAARILGRWKHPSIVRSRIERDVKPKHIDAMLKSIVARGAPTIATDVMRWTKRMFDNAVKREMVPFNPASAFDLSDAGGKKESRTRWLTRAELAQLLSVMKTAVWHLPADRTKSSAAIDIPLPVQALAVLRELVRLAGASAWLLPARKMETRMLPHIDTSTINAALAKYIRPLMKECEAFSPHDFRRTARTHLEALGVTPHVAERCLNHKITGIAGVYNRHDYFEERRAGLQKWADLLAETERGFSGTVVPIKKRKFA